MTKFKILLVLVVILSQSFVHADNHAKYKSVMDYMNTADNISIFTSLLTTGYLNNILKTEGEYTIFAFTNEAYERLPSSLQKDINTKAYRSWRARVLTNHIVDEAIIIPIENLPATVTSIAGNDLTLSTEESQIIINNARILNNGVRTGNGVVYVVDSMIIP